VTQRCLLMNLFLFAIGGVDRTPKLETANEAAHLTLATGRSWMTTMKLLLDKAMKKISCNP